MPPVFSMAPPLLWLIRTLATAAAGLSCWLTLQKWLGPHPSLAGCGGVEACASLLDSRWSHWFSVPVTLLSAVLWLAVLLLTLPTAGRWLGRTADQLLAACAVLLLAGALWFGYLMAGVVKMWCPWCAALHLAAVITAMLLLYSTWRASRQGELGLFCFAGQAGITGAALLVLGQLFGKVPGTHLITPEMPAAAIAPLHSIKAPVSFLNGTLLYSRLEVPSIGTGDAQHILAGFSDYTCPACRAQHGDLKALLQSSPGTYAVLILPTPLDRACNPHLEPGVKDHPQACALASLALSFWKAAPELFPDFHDFLMTSPLPLETATARAEAKRLAPHLEMIEDAPWITAQIAANVRVWHQLSSGNHKLPKLLLRDDQVLHGSTSSRERFLEIIGETFSSFPDPTGPGIPVTVQTR